jgi:hypothetical protein
VLSSKGIEYIEGLLVKWERLYQEMAPSRRWAVSGPNKVVYVAPSSGESWSYLEYSPLSNSASLCSFAEGHFDLDVRNSR